MYVIGPGSDDVSNTGMTCDITTLQHFLPLLITVYIETTR